MSWHELEMLARGGTLSLLALWSWLLWRDHREMLAARVGIAMNLGIGCYVIMTAAWAEYVSEPNLVLGLLARSTPALFWLFARTWFNDRTRLARSDVLIVAAWIVTAAIFHFSHETWPAIFRVSGAILRIGMFMLGLAGLWEAWRGREDDLVEARRRMRLSIVVAVGLYVVIIGAAEMAVNDAHAPPIIIALIGSSIVFITLVFLAAMLSMRQGDLFGAPAAPGPAVAQPHDQDDPLAARLAQYMSTEMPHRDERLTIAGLAQRLGEQEYRLRRLINGSLGHRNFAQFLNSYRLAEVKAALADPAQKEVPILTVALDAGFGSLGPFNRAFREAEGMTPSEYRTRSN